MCKYEGGNIAVTYHIRLAEPPDTLPYLTQLGSRYHAVLVGKAAINVSGVGFHFSSLRHARILRLRTSYVVDNLLYLLGRSNFQFCHVH